MSSTLYQASRLSKPKRPLRVALDTSFAGVNLTGVGKYSRRMAEELNRIAATGRIDLRCFGPSCSSLGAGRPLGGLYQEWPTYTQLFVPLALARCRPDVVHATSHLGPLWGRGRLVVTVHDIIFKRFPSDYNSTWLAITETLLPRVLKRASAVIADSQTTKGDLEQFYPWAGSKIHVIYPGIDEAFRAPVDPKAVTSVRRRFELGDGPYIVCLGPWVRRKNIETVIRAFRLVAEQIPVVKLIVTGKPALGMESANIHAALKSLPLNVRERVVSAGHLPWHDVPPLVKGASALTYPSLFEGFGLPPLEAMAAGVPVVVSDTPVVAEATGDAGLIVSVKDPDAWAAALVQVLTDGREAERLAEKGRARSAQFTWQRCARETLALYYSVAKGER